LAARDGHEVTLLTALGRDEAGEELRGRLSEAGVEVIDTGLKGATPEKIRFFVGHHPLMRLDRGHGRAAGGGLSAAARAATGWADAVLVSDYGRGMGADPAVRAALGELAGRVPVVWDPHPRGAAPVTGCAAVTPNLAEASGLASGTVVPSEPGVVAEHLRGVWRSASVCVTCGARGAVVARAGAAPVALPVEPAPAGDACGAGDRFASRLAGALAAGRGLLEGVREAVAVAGAFVAAGGARRVLANPDDRAPEADAASLARRVRASGGTVVATGGCFDLLHAGHVSTLVAARSLGDCLIVCLNSDASVRRLKGPGRPVVAQADRAAVLAALACVDGVAVFDEQTPEAILRTLRPHLWVKGGDYAGVRLPEADVLAEWGGRAYLLPYLDGHSTTRLIEEAAAHA
jgi:rfaE bifunctional protein nucleotidyltransferase chain/domain